jgi:hypothetical protein
MGRNRQVDGYARCFFWGAVDTTQVSLYGALVKRIAPVI